MASSLSQKPCLPSLLISGNFPFLKLGLKTRKVFGSACCRFDATELTIFGSDHQGEQIKLKEVNAWVGGNVF